MHIGIVFRTNGTLSGGSAKHLENLVPLLRQDGRVSSVDLLVPKPALAQLDRGLEAWTWGDTLSTGALRRTLAALRPDVVFVPTARWFEVPGTPVVVMVRNMEPLARPLAGNSFLDGTKNLARRVAARRACTRADRVIAVSDFVRSFLTDQWGIPAGKVGRVYHGVSRTSVRSAAPLVERVGAGRRFFLCAGSIRPARGLEDIIQALAALGETNVDLVIAGDSAPGSCRYHRRLVELTERLGMAKRVTWLGSLTPLEMAWCFDHCVAFISTTRVEACPNVALEAMAHGCVIVSAECPPMPEFFRNTAIYYPPGGSEALAANLRKVLAMSADERGAYAGPARRRATDFDWKVTAKQTADELLLTLG